MLDLTELDRPPVVLVPELLPGTGEIWPLAPGDDDSIPSAAKRKPKGREEDEDEKSKEEDGEDEGTGTPCAAKNDR